MIYAADVFIDSVVDLASHLRVSRMVISLTVVAVGTSLPEVMSSGSAAWLGHPEIAIGNVIGSNICNVGLILGLPTLFYAITCRRYVLIEQGLVMLGVSFFVWIYSWLTGGLDRIIGLVFLAGFAMYIFMVFSSADSEEQEEDSGDSSSAGSNNSDIDDDVEVVKTEAAKSKMDYGENAWCYCFAAFKQLLSCFFDN